MQLFVGTLKYNLYNSQELNETLVDRCLILYCYSFEMVSAVIDPAIIVCTFKYIIDKNSVITKNVILYLFYLLNIRYCC